MTRGVKAAPQPHDHPKEGPLDARGNCRGCAAFDPDTAGQGGTVVNSRGPRNKEKKDG